MVASIRLFSHSFTWFLRRRPSLAHPLGLDAPASAGRSKPHPRPSLGWEEWPRLLQPVPQGWYDMTVTELPAGYEDQSRLPWREIDLGRPTTGMRWWCSLWARRHLRLGAGRIWAIHRVARDAKAASRRNRARTDGE